MGDGTYYSFVPNSLGARYSGWSGILKVATSSDA